jgi:hypothetical protein
LEPLFRGYWFSCHARSFGHSGHRSNYLTQ